MREDVMGLRVAWFTNRSSEVLQSFTFEDILNLIQNEEKI